MRLLINLVLVVVAIFMAYLLMNSIKEPIAFKAEKDKRHNAVIDKLIVVRKMQEFYRDISGGSYAPSFDTLKQVLTEGDFMNIKVVGDPDDPDFMDQVTYDTSYIPAIDTIRALGISLDSLRYVPYSDGAVFNIEADTLTYQSTLVNVVEVSTRVKDFMGAYADPRFAKYDNSYNPSALLKFGDLFKPNLSGNWER